MPPFINAWPSLASTIVAEEPTVPYASFVARISTEVDVMPFTFIITLLVPVLFKNRVLLPVIEPPI